MSHVIAFILYLLPFSLFTTVHMYGDGVLVWAHYSLNIVLIECGGKVFKREGPILIKIHSHSCLVSWPPWMLHLQYPGPLASEGVSSMHNVPVLGEAGEHVLHTLLQGVDLTQKYPYVIFQPINWKILSSVHVLTWGWMRTSVTRCSVANWISRSPEHSSGIWWELDISDLKLDFCKII